MDSIERNTYSYGPFLPRRLPDSLERAGLLTILRSNGRCAPSNGPVDYGRQSAPTLAKVAEYDIEIAKVQAILTRMREDRSILQYHANGCASVSAPIRRLPDEMLLEIFHLCSPLQHPTYYDDWREYYEDDPLSKVQRATPRYRYLLQLAQVCASWRSLIMDSPALWAKIEVDFTHLVNRREYSADEPILATEILGISRVFLERSALAPLQIHLRGHNFGLVPYGPVLDSMVRQSHRWTHAKIWPGAYRGDFAAFASVRGNLALLESLHVSNLRNDCDFFEFAPRLTELTLEEPIPSHPKLPWGQIRTLSYARLFSDELNYALSHLSHCTQLAKLVILRLYISARDDPFILPPLISDVQSLALGFTSESDYDTESPIVSELLGCFTLRRAHTLHFETENSPLPWHHTAFLALCSRSSLHDTLRTLEIDNLAISAAQLLECLSALPRLETLSISDPNPYPSSYRNAIAENPEKFLVTDILLRGLTLNPDSEDLVPHLHTFDCKTFMQFEHRSYLDFIASRVGPGRNAAGPFQSSILYFRDIQVNPLLEEGLAEFVLRQQLRSRFESDRLNALWVRESPFYEDPLQD
ncbi:hypothetical protein C8F04DRAFT_381817 [Mycena alexandri]|uniref:F-box domain-containing protein n=1 Tax=Mycena alexandri TaxID=1745969 RepID=A0AAD6WN08_9AGAR|nr:hypothetical protein C8F04DRAFT_381817 [Mycena alexandri]